MYCSLTTHDIPQLCCLEGQPTNIYLYIYIYTYDMYIYIYMYICLYIYIHNMKILFFPAILNYHILPQLVSQLVREVLIGVVSRNLVLCMMFSV